VPWTFRGVFHRDPKYNAKYFTERDCGMPLKGERPKELFPEAGNHPLTGKDVAVFNRHGLILIMNWA
jgi:hypothetical protein